MKTYERRLPNGGLEVGIGRYICFRSNRPPSEEDRALMAQLCFERAELLGTLYPDEEVRTADGEVVTVEAIMNDLQGD